MGRRKHVRIVVIGFWVFVFVLGLFGWLGPLHYPYLQTVALTLTLIAVVWYAEVTRQMYLQIKHQTDIALESHKSYKLSVAADWLLKLDDRFDSYELTEARLKTLAFLSALSKDPDWKRSPEVSDSMEELD